MEWYCNDCGSYFDETEMEQEVEYHSELKGMGGINYETFGVCPYCRSEDIQECEQCDLCGDQVNKTYYISGKDLCEDCANKLKAIMTEAKDKVVAELNVDSLDAEDLITYYFG